MKKIFTLLSTVLFCLGANAQAEKLADVIKSAVASTTETIVPVFLDEHKTYELDSYVDLGTQATIIWGGGATITVKGEGQLATSAYFEIRNAKFECAEAGNAIFGLSKEPDASLKINDETSTIKFEGANQKVFWNDSKLAVINCVFANLKHSLVYANKQPWAIAYLSLRGNVIQLEGASIDPVINWYGSSTGGIKNLVLENNTIYNITAENEASWMIRMGNASNAQPQKIWGTNGEASFIMLNNTIAFPGKAFANNFPNKNNVTLLWKKNIFINTPYLQKIGGSLVRDFTNADNTIYFNNGKTADNTDQEKFGTVEEIGVTVPQTALDLNDVSALAANFRPAFATNTTTNEFGAKAWAYPFKSNIAKTPGYAYEVVLGPDMLAQYALAANCNEADLGKMKPGINTDLYPWIQYVRGDDKNVLTNGQHEAQKSNRWTDLNPVTGEKGTWLQVTGKNGSVESPVISGEWNKWMEANITDATLFRVYATGSASTTEASGEQLVLTATATDGTVATAETTPGTIWGKGKASDVAVLTLDPAKAYLVKVESKVKDVQVIGIRVYNADETVFPVCHAPGEKYPGTNYEVVLGPDMLDLTTLTLQGNCDEAQIGVVKPGIDTAAYPWIKYVRGDDKNVLSNGQHEAQKSNRWTDLNPATGEKGTWIQATGKNGSVESPVISGEWNKWMEANITDATLFRVYATGSASTTEASGEQLVLTATANDGTVLTAATTPGTIWGKGKGSDYAELQLDPYKAYIIKIESAVKDVQITGFNITGTDLTLAPEETDPGLGDPTGIEEVETTTVETPAYNIAGQRVANSAKGLVIKNGKKFIVR